MSIKIMSAIWDGGPKGATLRFVLIALADNANDDGECWPSVATVSRKTGLCERAVRMALRQLEADGWLATQVNGGRGGANRYTINPAPNAPGTKCPSAPHAPPPRHDMPHPPAPNAPEPSLNHQNEPSLFGDDAPKPKKRRKPEVELPEGWVPNERNIKDAHGNGFSAGEIDHEADRVRDDHMAIGNKFRECDEILPTLSRWCSTEAAKSFMAYRRKQKGKALTLTAARRQAEQLRIIFNAGLDPSDALGMAEERGWQSVQADWYFKAKGNGNGEQPHGNSGPRAGGTGGGMVAAFAAVAERRSAKPR